MIMREAMRHWPGIVLALAGATISCGVADHVDPGSTLATAAFIGIAALSCTLLLELAGRQ
jgi:hypothetical protein